MLYLEYIQTVRVTAMCPIYHQLLWPNYICQMGAYLCSSYLISSQIYVIEQLGNNDMAQLCRLVYCRDMNWKSWIGYVGKFYETTEMSPSRVFFSPKTFIQFTKCSIKNYQNDVIY